LMIAQTMNSAKRVQVIARTVLVMPNDDWLIAMLRIDPRRVKIPVKQETILSKAAPPSQDQKEPVPE